MDKIVSKTGSIRNAEEKIYTYLSDFRNIEQLVPKDKVNEWRSDQSSCDFSIPMAGKVHVEIIDQEPYKMIKFSGEGSQNVSFHFWIQLKQIAENDTRVRLTLQAKLPKMMELMAKKPLQKGLDMIVDRLSEGFDINS